MLTRPLSVFRSVTQSMKPRTFAQGCGSQGPVEGPALGALSKGTFRDTNAATATPSTRARPPPIAAYRRTRFLVTAPMMLGVGGTHPVDAPLQGVGALLLPVGGDVFALAADPRECAGP